MFWAIQFFPRCSYHVFLPHCAEDRDTLVFPLYESLRSRGIRVWLDRHDYPYGRGSRAALRDAIIACRHVVFLITDAMLASARGWCVQELAWTELLQDNLLASGGPALLNAILPLYLVEPLDARLPRSVWQGVRERGPFRTGDVDPVVWTADQIVAFLRREEKLAHEFKRYARANAPFRTRLRSLTGLYDRVTRFDPQPLPRVDTEH